MCLAGMAFTKGRLSRSLSIFSTGIGVVIASAIAASYLAGGLSLSVSYAYLPYIGTTLSFSATGISVAMLLMASIVLLVAALSGNPEQERLRLSSSIIVLFQAASVGLFVSSNMLLFFIFWDIGVIAMFVMINMLGAANRRRASLNFIIYEIFASSLLLLGIMLLYAYSPGHSMSLAALAQSGAMPQNVQLAIFFLFFMAFLTNMPVFPMHFWLPDAHSEASTQGSMLLSGILTKFGGYGMLLLFISMPIAHDYSKYVAALSIFSAIYAALVMSRQTDIKRIVAYTTIVDMSIILVAISAVNTIGNYGAIYGMLSHGLAVSLLFLCAGNVKYMFNERNVKRLRGIIATSPALTYGFAIGMLSTLGLPLTSGFVADLLIFIGSVQGLGIYALLPLAAIALMGGFLYLLFSRSFLYVSENSEPSAFDHRAQKAGYLILAVSIVAFGVAQALLLNHMFL